jgi:mono/diheme cytochrome c family protein
MTRHQPASLAEIVLPRLCLALACALVLATRSAAESASPAPTAAAAEFFEKEIRPILVGSCGQCHGAEKQRGELRLDSRQALLKGGETGPAIVPGNPEKSLLVLAVRQTGDVQMPPKGKLKDEQIAALEHWVKMGAPWPAEHRLSPLERAEAQRKHWAFQPIGNPAPPAVHNNDWCQTPIDRFVLSRLEARQLAPSPRADRRTLIRRVSYDLTGLPPSPAEVEEFVRDPDPNAYTKLVDRLLASPQYGEHWARHWLDLARYSDTKGYVYAREERFWVHASSYRDWVVRAFNEDLSYDRFLLLQIAADQVAPHDPASWAAMGFLTLGRRFLGVTYDIIDDRIDVVTRGTMGLTVACARCHDHKYDPIPTADYYSLYGVFQNCAERFVPIEPARHSASPSTAFEQEFERRQQKLQHAMATSRTEATARARQRVSEYLLAQLELQKYPEERFNQMLTTSDLIPAFVRNWQTFLAWTAKTGNAIFIPWHRFASLRDDEFSSRAGEVTKQLHAAGPAINPLVAAAFATPPASMREVAERYGRLFVDVDRQWHKLCGTPKGSAASPLGLSEGPAEALRQVLDGPLSPCFIPEEGIVNTEVYYDSPTIVALWGLQGQVDRLLIESPQAPPYAVALVDRQLIQEPRIFRRGNPATKGEEVPRRFLEVVAGQRRKPFSHGSGRLELAKQIASPDNPLTARVWANRVWMHHFGAGLVRTPSDFGTRAESPSHPQLLDWLARKLVTEGWSTKALHRLILLSSTYQQRSDRLADAAVVQRDLKSDPENRLLWRMNPRRLTFEEWRDTALAVSCQLDERMGGHAADLFPKGGDNPRRTLYGLVDRQFLPSVLRQFDFANPDLHVPQRSETTVAQQALFAMNHPFLADRARAVVGRLDAQHVTDSAARVRQLFREIYEREPTAAQRQAAERFLASEADVPPPATPTGGTLAWNYGYGALNESTGRVRSFHPLPHFTGTAWQGGPTYPDPALGWVQITADGGHPGNDLEHAAIRRWTAPRDGAVAIKSRAIHEVAAGDGIRCWIVSSRHGVLASAAIHHRRRALDVASVAVQAGDTLDFVVDIRANLNSDQHFWSIEIRELSAVSGTSAVDTPSQTWNSSRDFTGAPQHLLNPWEQLAQVLLLANELMFID